MNPIKMNVPRSWFFVLFTVSGFAGLIYESIWSHYLKLFLGHAAYAQTLVLAMFMGGMAIGSWICGRYSGRWRRLLLGYAAVEAVIGLAALVFHPAFVGLTDYAYGTVMPALGSPLAVNAFKWGFGALFILPQSILLGMTFPLMTAGVIRAYPENSGGSIAMLYFTNSLGAAGGVLTSAFLLIAWVGLPGTILTAGLINLLLAAIVWLLARSMPSAPLASQASAAVSPRNVPGYRLMLAVALLTGAASFMYEIGWIRMLSMVLGSSTHAFELMLSAFILGLAFGSRWIKRRIERAGAPPERLLGIVQVAMGMLALATLLVYGQSFELMQVLLDTVAHSERGYTAFNFGSHLIALLVMFPAAFCAGMTLPLITHALLERRAGERAIGSVYAANMVGSIAGVFLAVHFGMPVLGLKGLISLGAAIDIALGLVLLWWIAKGTLITRFATVGGAAALAATLGWVQLDSLKMASGVYRLGRLFDRASTQVLYHQDGKTATVNLIRVEGRLVSVTTNGKPDASINFAAQGDPGLDESTMILTAALPLAIHPQARSAANIGFGSGLTSHVLLASGAIRELDTIEIEPAMVDAARGFNPRNSRVYEDPRSRIYIEDAKSFFSVHNKRYDIVVSEPSNPWVSGVAGLFTEEFYRRVKRHLNSDGVFVQWMQLYDINPTLVASVFKALGREFSDYAVYAPNDNDIIIVARDGRPLPRPSNAVFSEPALVKELERIRIRAAADFDLHRVGGKALLQPYFEQHRIAANSEYFPVLETRAARARFMQENALAVSQLAMSPIPLELLDENQRRTAEQVPPRPWLRRSEATRIALEAKRYLLGGQVEALASVPEPVRSDFELVRLSLVECSAPRGAVTVDQLSVVMDAMLPFLTPEETAPLWARIGDSPCGKALGEPERKWLSLYKALGAGRAGEAGQVAAALLRSDQSALPARRQYLLAVAVVGNVAEGDVQRAQALWREFGPAVGRGSDLADFLWAHLASRL